MTRRDQNRVVLLTTLGLLFGSKEMMRTALITVLLLSGMQSVVHAQLDKLKEQLKYDGDSEGSGSSVKDLLGEDFFDFRRPKTLRAAPQSNSQRSVSNYSHYTGPGYGWDYRFDAQF
jgi:hypothetical protein